jgi:hypothetical protein
MTARRSAAHRYESFDMLAATGSVRFESLANLFQEYTSMAGLLLYGV